MISIDIISVAAMLISTIPPAVGESDGSVEIFGVSIPAVMQVITLIIAVIGIVWTAKEKIQALRSGNLGIRKSAYEQLDAENKMLIKKSQLLRKDSDKWLLLRTVVLGQPGGDLIVRDVENKADQISSDEN